MFYSEHNQDRYLSEAIFKGRRNGIFAEIGALDGLLHSNTLQFEKDMGWRGLLVEANPASFEQCRQNRPDAKCLHAAVWDRGGVEVEFEAFDGGLFGWSGIREAVEPQHRERINRHISLDNQKVVRVPCITLAAALAGMSRIDYVSLDIEGAEYAALSVFPFSMFDVEIWDIEDNWGNNPIEELMGAAGYRQIIMLGPNRIFQKNRG